MSEKMKARSAARRSRALGVVFAGATNTLHIAPDVADFQQKRILARVAVSPAVAAAIAEMAFSLPENWRRA